MALPFLSSLGLKAAPALIGGLGSLFGGKAQGNAQRDAARLQAEGQKEVARMQVEGQKEIQREQLKQQQDQFLLRKQAYDQMVSAAGKYGQGGETALYELTKEALPELAQMKQDLMEQHNDVLNRGVNQMKLNLSQAGVRGGQAATLLNRGIGDMTRKGMWDINQLTFDEASKRKMLQQAYEMSKAQAGIQGQMQPSGL